MWVGFCVFHLIQRERESRVQRRTGSCEIWCKQERKCKSFHTKIACKRKAWLNSHRINWTRIYSDLIFYSTWLNNVAHYSRDQVFLHLHFKLLPFSGCRQIEIPPSEDQRCKSPPPPPPSSPVSSSFVSSFFDHFLPSENLPCTHHPFFAVDCAGALPALTSVCCNFRFAFSIEHLLIHTHTHTWNSPSDRFICTQTFFLLLSLPLLLPISKLNLFVETVCEQNKNPLPLSLSLSGSCFQKSVDFIWFPSSRSKSANFHLNKKPKLVQPASFHDQIRGQPSNSPSTSVPHLIRFHLKVTIPYKISCKNLCCPFVTVVNNLFNFLLLTECSQIQLTKNLCVCVCC